MKDHLPNFENSTWYKVLIGESSTKRPKLLIVKDNNMKKDYKKIIQRFNSLSFKGKLKMLIENQDLELKLDYQWSWIGLKGLTEDEEEEILQKYPIKWDNEFMTGSGNIYDMLDLIGIEAV